MSGGRCSAHGVTSPCLTCLRNDPDTPPGLLAAIEREAHPHTTTPVPAGNDEEYDR